ncbi:CubicO group peptidase, beta-lactamase class C family [Leuconostocaceae bacterium R-53105]|uniref:CubicO group peptidase (Beta-lactamase class C family) n=1 Tax=Convivina intestini TaxID=1505726 RepID=A0A2U1DFB4_9LACO|nr:CubicO group peptidase (beta-lactamase class C family) [Convivina intestini]CAH1851173.1 Putative penicillin-binding protein PbpX [Convivina intestini]SDB81944.1 CubicO group peptidase, beta-lactamase class C family [Leuconostocaceae bacterium R-53105]
MIYRYILPIIGSVLTIVLVLVLLISKLGSSPNSSTSKSSTTKQQLAKVDNKGLSDLLKSEKFSGVALVYRRDKIVLNQAYGYADQKEKQDNQISDRYYIGSAQKSVIATAVLQLEQHGKLKVDQPVSHYFSDFPNGANITLKNLLNHTSGLNELKENGKSVTPKELVHQIMDANPNPEPGSWRYSDSNYAILAYIVEMVSKQNLADYVQKNIFNPSGMVDSGFNPSNKKINHLTTSYRTKDGNLNPARIPYLSELFGAGDMYTNAVDVYRFDKALMQGDLLNEQERAKMFDPGSRSTYGMGFYVNPSSYSSHGILGGFNTINTFTHTGKTYIVLITNTDQVSALGKLSDKIYQYLSQQES